MTQSSLLELSQRAPIYRWIAQLLIAEVDAAGWRGLREEPVRSTLARLVPALDRALTVDFTTEVRDAHAEEYARLFLLPNGVSPFASSWIELEGLPERSRDELAVLVERGFESLGRVPNDVGAWGRVPRDHVALILDLVSQAASRAAQSQRTEDREIAEHLDAQLVGAWIGRFARALGDGSRLPLYRALGRLLDQLNRPL